VLRYSRSWLLGVLFPETFPVAVLHTVKYCRLLLVRGVLRCTYLTGVRSLFDLNAKLLDMGQDGLNLVYVAQVMLTNLQKYYFHVFSDGVLVHINPLKTKRRPLYLKTQSVPRCKHFLSRL
jgi:hypothetical protein